MLDVRHPELRPHAFEGNFGLEREALRVTGTGRMALTPHPFPPDHPRIVRDFCENQTEINTGVHATAEAAVEELKAIDATIRAAIAQQGERLWTNSNPPPTLAEDEIVPAKFDGTLARKSVYRDYLAAKYGKQLMAYCGIHVNFSFGERLIEATRVKRDELYLHVAAFKAAASLDFDRTPVGELLERMDEFFSGSAGWPSRVRRVLAFEAEKVYRPEKRYARMEACHV